MVEQPWWINRVVLCPGSIPGVGTIGFAAHTRVWLAPRFFFFPAQLGMTSRLCGESCVRYLCPLQVTHPKRPHLKPNKAQIPRSIHARPSSVTNTP